jgi:hypothetical protein
VKKGIKRLVGLVLLTGLSYGIYYCSISFPIISGYGAKYMCSSVFITGRTEQQMAKEELGKFPISLASYEIDYKDSTVIASVLGFARAKAIYRRGLGVTLVNEISEEQLRKQEFYLPNKPEIDQDTINWPMGNRINDSLPSEINNK